MSKNQNKTTKNSEKRTEVDWNERAGIFDRWLPYIQPVAEALLDLADVCEGQHVLDVASGTGEPALTLARRFKARKLTLVGVDGATAMVSRANEKAQSEGLSQLSFLHMQAEALQFEDACFDRVTSRFGAMLFSDSLAGLKEMRRVLKPCGKMVLAVWGEFQNQHTMYLIWEEILKLLPEADHPAIPRIGDLGAPGTLENLLKAAHFEAPEIQSLPVIYRFDDFEDYWQINTASGLLNEPLGRLSLSQQEKVKQNVKIRSQSYQKDGALVFQNEAILARIVK